MNRVHGGNRVAAAREVGFEPDRIIDFSASINPLGPPDWFRSLVNRVAQSVCEYPDPDSENLRRAAGLYHGVAADRILVGNGASEIIFAVARLAGLRQALIPVPSYGDYRHACEAAGLPIRYHRTSEESGFRIDLEEVAASLSRLTGGKCLVWLARPNNPTGHAIDSEAIRELCTRFPDAIFAVDESFADFLEDRTSVATEAPPNAIVIRSLTKFYGVPGLRVGYAVADEAICRAVAGMLPTWSINVFAQAFGRRALADREYQERTRAYVRRERGRLARRLVAVPGLAVVGGQANFLLVRTARMDAQELRAAALRQGCLLRNCSDFEGMGDRYLRIAVRTAVENETLCNVLETVLEAPRRPSPRKKRSVRLMFQGTSSNAGKSVLTAAFCRMLLQDGLRVAPFKAQNMSLNSFVTADGGEIGRAQVVQAAACRIEPDVRMNPVLLKPSSDTGSQVIVRGKPIGVMDARRYQSDKTELFAAVSACFDELAEEYDAVVLEGAGSPGEVNLKRSDIVNMRMAAYAEAPVLLVGDIDRGGVFASFVGTLGVLDEWERRLVSGFVINRFRGDASLVDQAVQYTFEYTGKPTYGIVPMIRDLGLPEEDSVSFKERSSTAASATKGEVVRIGFVDLPHVSNFTDADALENEPDVELRIVRASRDLDGCDAVILPGSKNVFADLRYLHRTGLSAAVADAASRVPVVGICGGYQMLGSTLSDPHDVESADGTVDGLGLLDVATEMGRDKVLAQTLANHLPTELPIRGYEIHHGRTSLGAVEPWIRKSDGAIVGVRHPSLDVYGTYLHGLFDADEFRRWFVDGLRSRIGLSPVGRVVSVYDIDAALDRLADVVRHSVDVKAVYAAMGL